MPGVFVGVGSNVDPELNVPRGVQLLAQRVPVVAVSTFYLTPPEGGRSQPPFVNGVLQLGQAVPSPEELKWGVLRAVEDALGRTRTADKYAPRVIDLDLLLYGDLVLDTSGLRIPDPEITRRAYVAVPLWELAPCLVLPGDNLPIADVAAALGGGQMEPLPVLTDRLRSMAGV